MGHRQHLMSPVARPVATAAIEDEPVFSRMAVALATDPKPGRPRLTPVPPTPDEFPDQIRSHVEAARQAERNPWSSRPPVSLVDRGRWADMLLRTVQQVFREAVGAADGALRYSTSLRLEGTAHTLEWLDPAPRRSLTIVVNERAVVWSWTAPDRRSLDNRVDPLQVDLKKIQTLVLDLVDHGLWSSDLLPSFVH